MYTVLPTHTVDAGVTIATVGILLSANRFVRLLLNWPIGVIYDRWNPRLLFVASLFIGTCSTAIYAFFRGFYPLLAARLLWGLAWVGIWIGGNTIILSATSYNYRGRWVGIYHISFYFGISGGALLGGFLTDRLGYHTAMGILASLTFLGAIVALLFLPETSMLRNKTIDTISDTTQSPESSNPSWHAQFALAVILYGVNRLTINGVLQPTFGLFLLGKFGDTVSIAGRSLGVATLTGVGLGMSSLISMISVPIAGWMSDRMGNRWQTIAGGLFPGIAGFILLAIGKPLTILFGVPSIATTGGSNQGLSTALVGDIEPFEERSRRLGILFTIGDLTSAIGPPLAYALIPLLGVKNIYLTMAGLLGAILFAALWQGTMPGKK